MSRIFSISILTSTIYYEISQFTYGTGHSKITLINKIIGSIINILLMITFIKKYGAIGAAWSTVLGYLVFSIFNILLLFCIKNKIFIYENARNTTN